MQSKIPLIVIPLKDNSCSSIVEFFVFENTAETCKNAFLRCSAIANEIYPTFFNYTVTKTNRIRKAKGLLTNLSNVFNLTISNSFIKSVLHYLVF